MRNRDSRPAAPMEVPVARLLTNHWFWLMTFVIIWIVTITVLIAEGEGAAPGV